MHPDRYMQKSSTEQDFSQSNSTYVNVAYRTLKDPTLRAKYLLQLEGFRALDERSKTADPALLMEVMELREEVDESSKPEALIRLIRRNRKAIDAVKKELTQLYTQKVRGGSVGLEGGLGGWDGMRRASLPHVAHKSNSPHSPSLLPSLPSFRNGREWWP